MGSFRSFPLNTPYFLLPISFPNEYMEKERHYVLVLYALNTQGCMSPRP